MALVNKKYNINQQMKFGHCHHQIIDKTSHKKRNCKNKTKYHFCKKHQQDSSYNDEYSICCLCGDKCNPCSQSCGKCARRL